MPQEQSGGQAASICTLLAHTVAALAATEAQTCFFVTSKQLSSAFIWLAGGGKGLGDLSPRWRVTTVSTASTRNQVRTPHTFAPFLGEGE